MLKISTILFILAIIFYVLDFFVFHYLKSDCRFHREFSKKAEKPLIAFLVGVFATNMLAGAVIMLLCGLFLQ